MAIDLKRSATISIMACVGLSLLAISAWAREPDGGNFAQIGTPPWAVASGSDAISGTTSRAEAVAPGIRVLLLACDDGPGPLLTLLPTYPDIGTVDWFSECSGNPTLAQLQAYDVVVVWSNHGMSDAVALGNVLADYADAGGRVILSVFVWQDPTCSTCNGLQGRLITGGYSPLVANGNHDHYTTSCLGGSLPGSPLMTGVATYCDRYRDYTSLAPGATLVASWSDEENFVASKGCVVAINSYPGPYSQATGDFGTLYHNAVAYLFGSGGCGPVFSNSFLDDLRRSQACVNSTSGAWQYTVLSGAGMGTYTGTGTATGSVAMNPLQIMSSPSSPYRFTLTYWAPRGTASATFRSGGFNSSLSDRNTKDDPPCGGTQPN